jgi:hypothetical protein
MLTIRRSKVISIVVAAGSLSALALFFLLAYQHTIIMPYLSPTILTVNGLQPIYNQGGMLSYSLKVDGYGSNCLSLTIRTLLTPSEGQENEVYYFKKADDCKHMKVIFGQYDYMRTFTYGGAPITGTPGKYKIVIDFVDLVNNQKVTGTRFFEVGQ